jgi:hypothetical protein
MADTAVSEKLLPPVFGKERRLPDVIKPVLQTRVLAFFIWQRTARTGESLVTINLRGTLITNSHVG